jgi:hypothetical protein
MDTTHEHLHLDRWSFVRCKAMDIPTSYILIISLFDETCKYGYSSKFWSYTGTNSEQVCVQIFNFVSCCIFANCFTC